jgi:hypothetical protein
MQYDVVFKDALFYVFRKRGTEQYFFTGIFGTVGVVPRSILMSDYEYQGFLSGKRKYLQELWEDIERNTEKYHARFVEDIDNDEGVIATIRETSFGSKETSFLGRLLKKFS